MLKKSYQMKESSVDLDSRIFEGYASTWDKDRVDDVIHPGAFKKSIKDAFPKNRIKILWQHFQPLGMPEEMREDKTGLYVRGRVSKTRLGDEALELMRDQVVDRLSIGFTIPKNKSTFDADAGIRHIHEVKLMEFSPVTFPANESAAITAVKSLQDQFVAMKSQGITDFSDLLTEIKNLEALIKQEPSIDDTPADDQQHEEGLDELKSLFEDLGGFARNRLY